MTLMKNNDCENKLRNIVLIYTKLANFERVTKLRNLQYFVVYANYGLSEEGRTVDDNITVLFYHLFVCPQAKKLPEGEEEDDEEGYVSDEDEAADVEDEQVSETIKGPCRPCG